MKSERQMKNVKSKLTLAVQVALLSVSSGALAQQSEDQVIEEVVATGTRLKGTASAVLQERQNQAFVADILGAEQISRTGDSDAASALRRVTGLTLVDGKFIYVRGLGERYSSTELNSMNVPSPDPTRSVIPLDLFPSSIIESLSVQKSFSPDMPAHFGGGNVDIRTRSIPTERVLGFRAQLGTNTENSGDSAWYAGGSDDVLGSDDGTRAISNLLRANLVKASSSTIVQVASNFNLSDLSREENIAILSELNRDITATPESLDPNYSFGANFGDYLDLGDDMRLGFLTAVSYSNTWQASDERNVYNLARTGDGTIGINEFEDGQSTEHSVKWSGMFNVGFKYNSNHRFEFNNMILHDARDRLRDRLRESTNTIAEPFEQQRVVDIIYEEREMIAHQLKGIHNFPSYWNIGADWYYSESEASREAPGGFEALFFQEIDENTGEVTTNLSQVSGVEYTWQTLQDEAKSYGWNASLPVFGSGYELEFKIGADFFEKARAGDNITVDLLTRSVPRNFLAGGDYSQIFSDQVLEDPTFDVEFEDNTIGGDKYVAAQDIDAYYFLADAIFGNWRVTGGVRYEDFKQISIPNLPHIGVFDATSEEIQDLAVSEDNFYPSLALTYQMDGGHQLRFNISETTIRPDLRDLSTSFYIDPLTDLLVRGSTRLQSSDLTNIDFRWEWYRENGNNLSVALFYKDIESPIELIELPSATEGAQQLLTANGETGEVYGVEIEFLQDLAFLGEWGNSFYTSGNFTFSDSEVTLGVQNRDSLFFEQVFFAVSDNTSDEAFEAFQITNAPTNDKRRLVGHSEWVANLQLGYDSDNGEHSASLVYNVFGPRIIIPGANGFEDGQEQPFHSLDLVYTYYPDFNTTIRFRARNVLDEEKQIEQEGIAIWNETVGTTFDIRFSYDF